MARAIGSAIINENYAPLVNEYLDYKVQLIGIYAKNREEWLILDVANMLYGFTMVPLYDTLGNF
jgi:long-chain acyl-CoA synthetase